jgi:hypothetical protein
MDKGGTVGRTNRPIVAVVHPLLWDHPAVVDLREKGNDIRMMTDTDADLIIGPNCWRVTSALVDMLPVAIKAARAIRYAKGEEESGEDS